MAPRRKEVEQLLNQARRDLAGAGKNIEIGWHEVAAFLCQQSLEKGLKALYLHTRKKRAPPTHSLLELGKELSAPAELQEEMNGISPDYVVARYPEAANGVPGEIYTKKMAEQKVAAAKEIWKWIDQQL